MESPLRTTAIQYESPRASSDRLLLIEEPGVVRVVFPISSVWPFAFNLLGISMALIAPLLGIGLTFHFAKQFGITAASQLMGGRTAMLYWISLQAGRAFKQWRIESPGCSQPGWFQPNS